MDNNKLTTNLLLCFPFFLPSSEISAGPPLRIVLIGARPLPLLWFKASSILSHFSYSVEVDRELPKHLIKV